MTAASWCCWKVCRQWPLGTQKCAKANQLAKRNNIVMVSDCFHLKNLFIVLRPVFRDMKACFLRGSIQMDFSNCLESEWGMDFAFHGILGKQRPPSCFFINRKSLNTSPGFCPHQGFTMKEKKAHEMGCVSEWSCPKPLQSFCFC